MSWRSAYGFSLLSLAITLGCTGPEQRYAAHEPSFVRFELDAFAHPESVDGWYACFETEDVEARKRCLANVLGVRVDAGHGAICVESGEPATLCRAFPYSTPDRVALEEESDDSGAEVAGGVAERFFEVLGQLLLAILECDDDEEHAEEKPPQRPVSRRSKSRDRNYSIAKPKSSREYHTKTPSKR